MTPPPAQCTMDASRMMIRMMTTNQKKNTTIPGMVCPATVLALATASSYPAPPGLSAAGVSSTTACMFAPIMIREGSSTDASSLGGHANEVSVVTTTSRRDGDPILHQAPSGLASRTRRLRASGTGDNRSWAAWLTIPRRIDRESGWRCPVAGSGRSSLFRAPAASPNCWRMAPGWPACGPPADVEGLAWVRAGPAGARSV